MASAKPPGLEVEAKVRLDGPEALRAALHRLGAASSPPAVEEDVFFTHPSRDLAAADEALRLRRTEAGFELTYKGPRRKGAYKAREERTVRVGDDPTGLLSGLGFAPSVRLRKQRQRFRLAALEVTLDHVEGLGWFAEVEAMGDDPRSAEAAVRSALRELGLDARPREERSYVELALAAGVAAAERV
jgi:adenylate cyclase, class 2